MKFLLVTDEQSRTIIVKQVYHVVGFTTPKARFNANEGTIFSHFVPLWCRTNSLYSLKYKFQIILRYWKFSFMWSCVINRRELWICICVQRYSSFVSWIFDLAHRQKNYELYPIYSILCFTFWQPIIRIIQVLELW